MDTLKLKLIFLDRKQIVEDIAKIVSANDLNIVSMEVENHREKTHIYIETENGGRTLPESDEIIQHMSAIPNLLSIRRIHTMPSEIKEKRLAAILGSISDGIIAVDRNGCITFINAVAKQMYGWDLPELTGKKLKDLPAENHDLLTCLDGKPFQHKKRNIITPQGRYQFFSDGITISDSSGQVTDAIEIMQDMKQIRALAEEAATPSQFSFSDIIGTSSPIMEAICFAQKVAPSSSVVSIRGESGTGKELFAKAIHTASGRTGEFVAVNCAALPETLLESELFGYEKGSFTGAEKKGRKGLFEIAHEGTLFLDEIAELPLGSQAKILRVIQEKSVRRIGGVREIPVDTRIITATSRLIEEMIKQNRFRQDLYYRINVLPIHVPPLKERYEDIEPLTDHFLSRIARQVGNPPKTLSRSAMEKLCSHHWPGNVRELKNVIERGAIISEDDTIDTPAIIFGHEIEKTIRQLRSTTETPAASFVQEPLKTIVGRTEKKAVRAALDRYSSIRKAARALKISHTAMRNKMKKYGLSAVRIIRDN